VEEIAMNKRAVATFASITFLIGAPSALAQLFAGIETGTPEPMRVSDLSGFPSVSWTDFHVINVSGAAATPDGTLYVCNGAFSTDLYMIPPGENPRYMARIDKDMSALAFGRGRLYGYSNYADPKGIYEIDPVTGTTTAVVDVYTGTGFRFFALDYNPRDDLLYGYTEYGSTGLYSIDIDTGEMLKIVSPYPASNTQGRGMAIGNNTVYVTATRGDDGVPFFAYDLSQGTNGVWVGFDNAYLDSHSTGGAAWVGDECAPDFNGDGVVNSQDFVAFLNAFAASDPSADYNGDGTVNSQDFVAFLNDFVVGC
jgi:hypothetical protein